MPDRQRANAAAAPLSAATGPQTYCAPGAFSSSRGARPMSRRVSGPWFHSGAFQRRRASRVPATPSRKHLLGEKHTLAQISWDPLALGPPRLSTFASLTYCGVGLSRIPVIFVLRWKSTIIGAAFTLPGTGTRPDKRVAFHCVHFFGLEVCVTAVVWLVLMVYFARKASRYASLRSTRSVSHSSRSLANYCSEM